MTTVTASGEMVGNTASSFNSVSLDPPLVLWSLARKAYSFETYMAAEFFAVNVLREGQDDLSAALFQILAATSGAASITSSGKPAARFCPARWPFSNAASSIPMMAATMLSSWAKC